MKQNLLIALALAVINFIAKYTFLDHSSLYLDEAYSVYYAQQSLEGLSVIFEKEANPPSYFFALHYWIRLFGISEVATRALSLLFSSLTIGGAFLLFRRKLELLPSLLMALSLAFSSSLFFYGNEVRVHAMSTFAGISSLYFLHRLLHLPNWRNTILHSVSLGILIHLHYANIVLISVELLVIATFLMMRSQWKLLPFYGISLTMALPIFLSIDTEKMESTASWLAIPQLNDIWLLWYQLSNHSFWLSWLFIISSLLGLLLIKDLKSKLILSMPLHWFSIYYLFKSANVFGEIPAHGGCANDSFGWGIGFENKMEPRFNNGYFDICVWNGSQFQPENG